MCEADPETRGPDRGRGESSDLIIQSDSDTLSSLSSDVQSVTAGSESLKRTKTIGEFDPGSGRTLAACLTHASQGGPFRGATGERVRNT